MNHLLTTLLLCIATAANRLVIAGKNGPGKGKHIVLVSADEEYPSEQALPQLARILSQRHGFDCSVLFAIDAATGAINPNQNEYSGAGGSGFSRSCSRDSATCPTLR